MKKTVFYPIHESLGARIVPFAGFLMPLEYSGINDEHMNVRTNAGIFDVSHMGEIWVKGKHALPFLQRVTSNDVSKLVSGKAQYSCMPNGKGGIVDDLLVYCFDKDQYLLVVNASNTEKDWQWLNQQNTFGVVLENHSDDTAQLAIQGPNAIKVLQTITPVDLTTIPYYSFTTGTVAGISNVIISNTGYTGAGGFELYFPVSQGITLWNALWEAGKNFRMKPAGLGCRDTLRLEMGYALYGNDIDDTTSPIEAGLGWITKIHASKNMIDQELLEKQLSGGVTRKLVGFIMEEMGVPRSHYPICDKDGTSIGQVTSGTMSPVLKKGIGMGYVNTAYAAQGSAIYINIRNKLLQARVVKPPFINPGMFAS